MEPRHRLLRKRVEETTDRDPLVAWALALWLSRYSDPSYAPYREVAEAQLKAAREQGKMDSKWPLRAKLQTDPVIAYALLQAAQWRPQGLSLTWQEMKELDKLRERLGSAAEERIVEFETHAALQDFDQLATSNPGEALDLAAQLDIAPGVYNHPYGAKLSVGQRAALQARVLTLRTERDRLARRQEANQLESDFRQRYEARLPEQARTLAERLFAPPPDFEVPVVLLGGRETSLLASRLRYARVSLEEPGMGRTKQGVVQNVHASPLRVVAKDPHLSAPQEWNLSRPGTRLIVEGLAPPLPDDILHGPPADFLSPEKRAWVEQARDELQQVLANPSGQRFWLLDFDDPVAPSEAGLQEPGEPSRFSVLEFDFDGPPPPPPKPTPPPKPVPTPPRAEADRALREFRAGLARDARTQAELAGHTLVRHWKLLTEAEQNEVRAGLAQLELRRSSRFANLEVDEPELLNEPVPVEEGPNRFKLLEIDAPPDSVQKLIDRWRRLVIGVQEAAPGRGVPADHAAQWLRQHKRRLLVALGGTPASVDAALAIPAVPPAPAGPPAAPAPRPSCEAGSSRTPTPSSTRSAHPPVSATASTHGSVTLASGTITYTPDAHYFGPASFAYQVCDNGTTNGALDAKCAIGTVNITVVFVPDTQPPTISCQSDIVVDFDPAVNGAVVTYTAPVGTDNRPGATTAQVAGLASGATFPLGTTSNTFTVTDAAGNTASCSFNVTVALTSIVGVESVTISGAAYADSFDSNGSYPATKGSQANILSNGTITLLNSGKVWGNVRSTRAGVVLSGATAVTGNATAGTTVSKSGSAVVNGTTTNNALAPVMTLPAVAACTSYSSTSGFSGTYSYNPATGNLSLSGSQILTLANGTYCFNNLTMTNSAQLKINGPVVIKLTGVLNVGGASVINNLTGVPGNLSILSSFSGVNGVIINNGTNNLMLVYAPQTGVSISGIAPVFGNVVGKSVVIANSGNLHYDIRLTSVWPALWSAILTP